jgi:hypothetical protein
MKIHRDVIAEATDEQLKALRDNILKDKWMHVPDDKITVYLVYGGTIMVNLHDVMLIGIEKDGYTHS